MSPAPSMRIQRWAKPSRKPRCGRWGTRCTSEGNRSEITTSAGQSPDSACGVAGQLHFHLFALVELRVVGAQDVEHLRPAEFRRDWAAFREPFAKLRAGDEQTVGGVVRTGPSRGHAAALVAPEGPVDLER